MSDQTMKPVAKQPYEKPRLTVVGLKPEERLLACTKKNAVQGCVSTKVS